jgi:hypothetical protein
MSPFVATIDCFLPEKEKQNNSRFICSESSLMLAYAIEVFTEAA